VVSVDLLLWTMKRIAERVAAAAEPITRWADRAVADRPGVDFSFWIEWSRRMGASAPA
jgi:hypothetical protein